MTSNRTFPLNQAIVKFIQDNSQFVEILLKDQQVSTELEACLRNITYGFDTGATKALCMKGAGFESSSLDLLLSSLVTSMRCQNTDNTAVVGSYVLCQHLLGFCADNEKIARETFKVMTTRIAAAAAEAERQNAPALVEKQNPNPLPRPSTQSSHVDLLTMRQAMQNLCRLPVLERFPNMGAHYAFPSDHRGDIRPAMVDHRFSQLMANMQPRAAYHPSLHATLHQAQVPQETEVPAPIRKRVAKLVGKIEKYQTHLSPDYMGFLRSSVAFREFFFPKLKNGDVGSVQDFSGAIELLELAAFPEKVLYALELIHADVKERTAVAKIQKHVR